MYKSWIKKFIFLSFSGIFLIISINVIIDPLQQYRIASFYKPYWGDSKYYNPGFAKNLKYDSVIIGSSMTENFLPSEINKELSFNTIKLSIAGSSARENFLMLDLALKTQKTKNVLYGIDIFSFIGDIEYFSHGKENFPMYLYDFDIFNDYLYLLSIDTLIKANSKIIASNLLGINKVNLDFDKANYWGDKFKFSKEDALREYRSKTIGKNLYDGENNLETLKCSFDHNLLSLIKEYPNVNFYLFYPPYSILIWHDFKKFKTIETVLRFKKYIFDITRNLKNVKIFDFQDDINITYNLDYYKDPTHYSPEVNKLIIKAIKNGTHVVDDNNIDKRLDNIKNQITEFEKNNQDLEIPPK